jgi:hypothetical protein
MTYAVDLLPLDLDLDLEELERSLRPTPGERLARYRERLGAWLRRHRADLAVVLLLLAVAGTVHAVGMYRSPARFDDEGTYTAYAWAVQYTHRLGHYTYWYAHPPLGWMQLAAWNWLTDGFGRARYAVAAGREFVFVCKLVSVALLYGLALRLRMTRMFAAGAVLLFALSPLAVYFTRSALLDNIVTPWLLGAFFLAAAPSRAIRAAAGSAACFAVAVLTKETALLFLPALAVLFWQHSDARNRRFTIALFTSTLVLVGALYPLYALVKSELFAGPGHVSLQWAIQWQLFERVGSGSIFDPTATAHRVVETWLVLDPWLPRLALALAVPGLLFRRTRAVAIAFTLQVALLLRSGYLPYPFVIAMIPFAALTAAGVLDVLWQWARPRVSPHRTWVWQVAGITGRIGTQVAVAMVVALFLTGARTSWYEGTKDLWRADRDGGKAAALAWMRGSIDPDQRVVVDDSFWVDLVRAGHPPGRVIWFTKLDVDSDVQLPKRDAWKAIDYLVLDHQDELSLHLTRKGAPTPDTRRQFPTLGLAIGHSQVVAAFGSGGDRVVVRRVVPQVRVP